MGIVVTISPSLSLYRIVVLPAASRPTIKMPSFHVSNNEIQKQYTYASPSCRRDQKAVAKQTIPCCLFTNVDGGQKGADVVRDGQYCHLIPLGTYQVVLSCAPRHVASFSRWRVPQPCLCDRRPDQVLHAVHIACFAASSVAMVGACV